ncbi:MAG: hypothetical protein JXQ76_00960 [Campylobacterales bacterium]|nr:hypothetical protein [Campylobacterales bacterium]
MSIKIFFNNHLKHIVLEEKISAFEIESFESAFNGATQHYEISFLNLKSIPQKMIERLYREIYLENHAININVKHPRLYAYLNNLGLKNKLISSDRGTKMQKIQPTPLKAISIGGSADSLEKIIAIVENIPLCDITIFVIQHIKEDAKPLFDSILQNKTRYQVSYPKDAEIIKEGHLYIAPPAYHTRVKEGRIFLDDGARVNYARPSLSVLFESIAYEYGAANITVLTCGYGHDGSDALALLRQKGSGVIISHPDECEAKDMVSSAIATKEYHHILKVDEIRSILNTLLQTVVDRDRFISAFLKAIKALYGYDFIKYDRGSVTRRIEALMMQLGIKSLPLLVKEVLIHKSLFDELLLSISINVTTFFRKPPLYVALRELLVKEFQNRHLKIWVAGCSTGEEAYTIAMILDELNLYQNALIYATDFNPTVIEEAKSGFYTKESINSSIENSQRVLKYATITHYLNEYACCFCIKEYLKKNVLFFTHNLVSDRSFNQFDIISCKNVLIYFTLTLQEAVFELFYQSLCDGGYLLLGESETLHPNFRKKFKTSSIEHKIYQKVA